MVEFKYNCIHCNYKTNNGQSWYQHNRTLKHSRRLKEFNDKLKNPEEILQVSDEVGKKSSELNLSLHKCKYCFSPDAVKLHLNFLLHHQITSQYSL